LRVEVAHCMEGHDTTLYLLPREIRRLIDRLTAEYYRAEFLSESVVRPV
jgi:hypothetical protein